MKVVLLAEASKDPEREKDPRKPECHPSIVATPASNPTGTSETRQQHPRLDSERAGDQFAKQSQHRQQDSGQQQTPDNP